MMLESTKNELIQLNKRRKTLLKEVGLLKKNQSHCLSKIQHDVSSYVDDHAEKYFGIEGEFAGKTFAHRFESSMKSMRAELRQLEQVIGINLHDMDDELDFCLTKLASKEKEFDIAEEQLHMPMRENKDFKDLIAKFLAHSVSVDPEKEYERLRQGIARKEGLEEELSTIITKREKQLERELQHVRNVFAEQRSQKRTVLETIAQSTFKELDSKRHQYREQIDAEREVVVRRASVEQQGLHEDYLQRYQLALASLQKYGSQSMAPEMDEDMVVQLSPTVSAPTTWKAELMLQQEELLEQARQCREGELQKEQATVQALQSQQTYALDPTPLEELAVKLRALYLRHNEALLKGSSTGNRSSSKLGKWPYL